MVDAAPKSVSGDAKLRMDGGIIKEYGDGLVVALNRFDQFETRIIQYHDLIRMQMVGYVKANHLTFKYWIICWQENHYIKVPFAKNDLWYQALTSELEYVTIKTLNQIILI